MTEAHPKKLFAVVRGLGVKPAVSTHGVSHIGEAYGATAANQPDTGIEDLSHFSDPVLFGASQCSIMRIRQG
jgi:hypothetical protein